MPQAKPHLKKLYRTPMLKNSRRGFLRLDMNESVDGVPGEFIKEVLAEIDSEFLATYPEYDALIKKIARHDCINSENICLSNGSDGAIKYLFDAYVSLKDTILLTDPTFAMYPVYCQMFDAHPIMIPYYDDFSFPLNIFLNAIQSDIRMAVIVNPNNPTGSIIKRSDMEKILNKCADQDVLLIIDEAYFYYYDETFIPDIKTYNNLVVLRTFSKLCGLASVRIGYAAACPEIIQNLNKVRPTYDVNGFAASFAEKILDTPGLIEQVIGQVNQGKDFLTSQLKQNNITYKDSKANFVLIKCPGFAEKLIDRLRKENILVSGGFKQGFLKDHLRVAVGNIQSMRHFCDVFIALWKELYKTA